VFNIFNILYIIKYMKTAIIYSYFETDQTIFNMEFYSKHGIMNSETEFYIIVISGYLCTVTLPNYPNLVILKRDNIGFDLGAHNYALKWLDENKLSFQYYIFMDSSVIGPFLPTYYPKSLHWSNIFTSKITNNVKLVGTTISCVPIIDTKNGGPKINGYCFATDYIGLNILKHSGKIFKDHDTIIDFIQANYDITTSIMEKNYTIDCLLYKYENIDWTDKNNSKLYDNIFPDRINSYDGISIHPFEVVFHKWFWDNNPNNFIYYDYCEKYSNWKSDKLNTKNENKIQVIIKNPLNSHPYYPLLLYYRSDIINLPNFNMKYNASIGLCNQLFGIITGIIKCFNENKKYVIIDSFLCCVIQHNICPISKIINLVETTKNINKIDKLSDIKLFDRNNFNMKIKCAKYGVEDIKTIDVTNKMVELYDSDIAPYENMNKLFNNDPCSGVKKYLSINYDINDFSFDESLNENCENFNNILKKKFILEKIFEDKGWSFAWYNCHNEILFNAILPKIRFSDEFYCILDTIKKIYNLDNNITVIHFRMEPDAIKHWAIQNKMSYESFEQKLCDKYNYLINKYTNENDRIYILSHDESYIINKFNNINIFINTIPNVKDELLMNYLGMTGRELSGIIDLLVGIHCSKLFIGCHSFKLNRGSTFSYMIAKSITCKKILIDLDDINSLEEVYD